MEPKELLYNFQIFLVLPGFDTELSMMTLFTPIGDPQVSLAVSEKLAIGLGFTIKEEESVSVHPELLYSATSVTI
jgi:hypothetical protein